MASKIEERIRKAAQRIVETALENDPGALMSANVETDIDAVAKIIKDELRNKPRVVVCAAIRNREGKIVAGARHWDSVMRGQVLVDGKRPENWLHADQGFIDQFGVWMNRQEAWKVAEVADQIRYNPGHIDGTLFSEDLY